MNSPLSGGWRRLAPVLIVGLLAFSLRLFYLGQIQESLFFNIPVVDARTYMEDGLYLSEQSWAGRPEPFWQAPLYPYALGLSFSLFGQNLYLPRLFQAILGTGICVLVFILGRRVFPFSIAFGAALTAAFYGPLLYYGGELLPTIPAIFLNLLLLLSLVRPLSTKRWPWLVSGLLLGLSTLTVANTLFFLPFLLFWLWSSNKKADIPPIRTLHQAGLLILGCLLIITPVTWRNYLVGGDLVLISHNAGINFYIGNNPDYDRTVNIRPGQDWLDLVERPEAEAGIVQPSARSRYFFGRSWDYIIASPVDYLKLQGRKLYLFWHGDEIRRNLDPYFARGDSGLLQTLLWKRYLAFPFGLVAPLALLGLLFFWRSKDGGTPQGRLLLYFVLAYMLSVVLFFVTARYRLPVVPVLLLFAGFGLSVLLRPTHRLKALVTLAGLLVVTNLGAGPMDMTGDTQQHFWIGYAYERKGMVANATRKYRDVLKARPDHRNALLALANLYNAQQQHGDAVRVYQQFLRFYPEASSERYLLGNAYLGSRQYQKAITVYTDLIPKQPQWAALHGRLGYAYLMAGQPLDAIQAYRQTLALKPDSSVVRYQLVHLYEKTDNMAAAAQEARTLLDQQADNPQYHTLLADLLIKQAGANNQPAQAELSPALVAAEQHLRQAVTLDPELVQTRWHFGALLVKQRRYAEAIEHFEKIRLLTPEDIEVHRHLGNLYKRTGDLETADKHFERYMLAKQEQNLRQATETTMKEQYKKIMGE
jgi:tetratricopeptide (TPR) repeat protein/4-amino-4-deoxy-L-arabinose transferase-like glycosyltransferase